jgi:hypothetical protein
MIISFLEEFPTENNLKKLKLIKFPTKIYVACKSINKFESVSKKIKKINKKAEAVCWILLDDKEGYWISPWAKTAALKRVFNELNQKNIQVLIDLEFPKNKSKNLIINFLIRLITSLCRMPDFSRNKRLIEEFIKSRKNKIFTAEYSYIPEFKLRFLGLGGYDSTRIKMLYKKPVKFFPSLFRKKVSKFAKRGFLISTGLMARGVSKFEWIASAEDIDNYLRICKQENVGEVVLFRLGGLDKDYLKVIEKYAR